MDAEDYESNKHPISQNASEALRLILFNIGLDIMLVSSVMKIRLQRLQLPKKKFIIGVTGRPITFAVSDKVIVNLVHYYYYNH
jgi:hypothetical protein